MSQFSLLWKTLNKVVHDSVGHFFVQDIFMWVGCMSAIFGWGWPKCNYSIDLKVLFLTEKKEKGEQSSLGVAVNCRQTQIIHD